MFNIFENPWGLITLAVISFIIIWIIRSSSQKTALVVLDYSIFYHRLRVRS